MAGRVYLCTIAALLMAIAHVRAFFLPPMVGPVVDPAVLKGAPFFPAPFFARGFRKTDVLKAKPYSRPFTVASLPLVNNAAQFPMTDGVQLDSSDALFVGDMNGIVGGGINEIVERNVRGLLGGNVRRTVGAANIGLAASNNDPNAVTLTDAVNPQDAQPNLDISDSTVLVNNPSNDLAYASAPLSTGLNTDSSDSTILGKNSGTMGGLPAGTAVTTY